MPRGATNPRRPRSPRVRALHANPWSGRPLQVALEGGDEHLLGHRADDLVDLAAVLVDHEGRDAHDAVRGGRHLVLIGVELAELDVGHLAGELLDDGADALAGAAPGGPEVDEDDALLGGELREV